MAEFEGLVTLKGNPVTLVGSEVNVGDKAPDVTVRTGLADTRKLSDASDKVVVLSLAPSVDTGVCATQLRTFNERATDLGDDVEIWFVTRDVIFALDRFCGGEDIENVHAYSDSVEREVGEKFGVTMKEFGLLARSVFVIGKDGKVAYKEIVPEMTDEPDYDAALEAVQSAR
jgi:thiol peroxidase